MTAHDDRHDSVLARIDTLLGTPPSVRDEHRAELSQLLQSRYAIDTIRALLADPKRLEATTRNSYHHTLGFDKITLADSSRTVDGKKHYGWQLRLHIWWPGGNSGVPIVEGMHEHSFDFVSAVMTGKIENQRFIAGPLHADEQALLATLEATLAAMPATKRDEINTRLEALETLRQARMGSHQAEAFGGVEALEQLANPVQLQELLGVDAQALDTVLSLYHRYEAVESQVKAGEYQHARVGAVKLVPHRTDEIRAGEMYFHPHTHIHRLFNADKLQSTLILTTPVSQEAKGGSLQRPSYEAPTQEKEQVGYARTMFTAEGLRNKLEHYLAILVVTTLSESFFAEQLATIDPRYASLNARTPGVMEDHIIPALEELKKTHPETWQPLMQRWRAHMAGALHAHYPEVAGYLQQHAESIRSISSIMQLYYEPEPARVIDDLSTVQFAVSAARRQPMHAGHAIAIEEILASGATLVYVAGSANRATREDGTPDPAFDPFKNPLTWQQQREQLFTRFPHLYDKDRIGQHADEPGVPQTPNMIFWPLNDTQSWTAWYEQVKAKLADPAFAREHGFHAPHGMLPHAAICFRGKEDDRIPELELSIDGKAHHYKNVYAFDCFRDYGVPVWHAAGHDTPFDGYTGTEFRDAPLVKGNAHIEQGLAAPEATIAIAEQARARNPDRRALEAAHVPVTLLDLTLDRMAHEAGIPTRAVIARAKATGDLDIRSLTHAGKQLLAEWKKGQWHAPDRTASSQEHGR